MNKKIIFRISFSLLLILYFIYYIDVKELASSFSRINIFFYLLSTGITIFGTAIVSFKYYLLIRKTNLALSFFRLMVINFISRFYALFLPSALGPEAVRWYKVTKNKDGKTLFFASIIAERVVFFVMMMLFGFIPLYFWIENPKVLALRETISPFVGLLFILVIIVLSYFLSPKMQKKIVLMIKKIPILKSSVRIKKFIEQFNLKYTSFRFFSPIFLFSFVWQVLFTLRIHFLFLALGLPFGLVTAAWMGALVFLLQALPVSFAGIGIREGAFAYFFSLYGMLPEQGITLGLLVFSQMLVLSLIGAFCNLFE